MNRWLYPGPLPDPATRLMFLFWGCKNHLRFSLAPLPPHSADSASLLRGFLQIPLHSQGISPFPQHPQHLGHRMWQNPLPSRWGELLQAVRGLAGEGSHMLGAARCQPTANASLQLSLHFAEHEKPLRNGNCSELAED